MIVVASWLRLELRRRWRSLVVLALLIAVSAAAVLTAVAGARRGASAVDRLLEVAQPSDITVLPNQPGFDWDAIKALPEVATLTRFVVSGYTVDGIPNQDGIVFPLVDDNILRDIERPVMLQGRVPDPRRVDEVMVSPLFTKTYGLGLGDTVTVRLFTPEEVDLNDKSGPASGPAIPARIVGVGRSVFFGDNVGSPGSLLPSPALYARYPSNFVGAENSRPINALLRLKGSVADIPQFRADLARVSGRSDIDVWNNIDSAGHIADVNRFESNCLLAFGLAAMVAALFLVGQSVARYTSATVADLQILRGLGMTPAQAVLSASAAPFLAAATGATLGVGAAIIGSNWMPIGSAALAEPNPGVDADWQVLAAGWIGIPLIVLVGSATAAWLALRAARSRTSPRRSAIASAAARAGLPVPILIGTRFALEPGRGRSAVPVRPALVGAVVGVLGVVAAFTFAAGVSEAAANPARFGQTHQLEAFVGYNGQDFGPVDKLLSSSAKDPDVVAVNDARIAVAESGNVSMTSYTYAPATAQALPVVLSAGRMPTSPDEVVLAPRSAEELGVSVGDSVPLTGTTVTRRATVTGIGFVPVGSHNGYADGAWITAAGYDQLFTGSKFHIVEVALRPGADASAVGARLAAAGPHSPNGQSFQFGPPQQLTEVATIKDVQVLPLVLGGFLALLAIGAIGHALATAVHRRRHDVAVLRALGMTRWQSRGVVVTQATLLALIGLLFGVPLGLALGRSVWRVVANITPLEYAAPLALGALLLVGPLAVLIANLVAAWPGRRAAGLRISQVLRAE